MSLSFTQLSAFQLEDLDSIQTSPAGICSGHSKTRKNFSSIIKYKQNTVKRNSINDFIKVYPYTVYFNDMFRL